jgi:hypothetical protein
VQPYTRPQNILRFNLAADIAPSTHRFVWQPDQIVFTSWKGDGKTPTRATQLQTWTYRGTDLPKAGGENVRFNLWLFRGSPPAKGKEIEVILTKFTFTPLCQP